jgi:hypothetical protein
MSGGQPALEVVDGALCIREARRENGDPFGLLRVRSRFGLDFCAPNDPGVSVFHRAGRLRRTGMTAVARLIPVRCKLLHNAVVDEVGRAKSYPGGQGRQNES